MTDSVTPICDLIAELMSSGLSPEMSLLSARKVEAAMAATARSSASGEVTRERWRLKKARQRAARSNVPGGQTQSAIIGFNTSKHIEDKKKESKSDSSSPLSPGDKPKRSKGDVLPADWVPTEAHYAKGVELRMSKQVVDEYADRMRNWADANAHRQVARKAGIRGWNAAFSNWLASAHERNNNGGGFNGKAANAVGGFSGLGSRLRQAVAEEEFNAGDHAASFESIHRR